MLAGDRTNAIHIERKVASALPNRPPAIPQRRSLVKFSKVITLENQSDDLKYSNIPTIEVFCSIKERTVATFRRGTV
jgi:hypothetical protein